MLRRSSSIFAPIVDANPENDPGLLPATLVTREQVPELDRAIVPPLHKAARDGKAALAAALLKNDHGDVHATDAANQTALHYACGSAHKDSLKIVKLLASRGANPNRKDFMGCTALHNAVRMRRLDVVRFLVQLTGSHPANVNVSDCRMNTPLHYAASYGQTEIAKLLVKKGAHLNVLNRDNVTPLHIAKQRGDVEIIQVIMAAKDKRRMES